MTDWTFALLFRPDIVKISLESEAALVLRELEQTADRPDAGHDKVTTGVNPAP